MLNKFYYRDKYKQRSNDLQSILIETNISVLPEISNNLKAFNINSLVTL